ncbi:MAG: hypothetical protein GC190_15475 [Alphaproteobacteria bacterium]|nr:hypothetical protein [Alphaproteobacteria bacterium]
MRGALLTSLALAAAVFAVASPAHARNLYFDMWCQEQGYSQQRCDARSPADVEAFEAYWRAVEKYEEQYYYERQEYARFRDELNGQDQAEPAGIQPYEPDHAARPR